MKYKAYDNRKKSLCLFSKEIKIAYNILSKNNVKFFLIINAEKVPKKTIFEHFFFVLIFFHFRRL